MDAKAKPEKVIEDAMMKLKIDPPSKASSINMSGPKGANQSDSTSCISSADATCSIKESDVDQEASVGDQGMHYYGYYYPGSTGCFGDLETQCRNPGPDNFQIEHHAIQADNGSVVYYLPGFQPGYNTYGSFLPGAIYGVDGQYLGQWPYYPSPQTPQPVVSPGLFPQPVAYGTELVPAYHWDPSLFFPNEIQGSTFTGNPKYPLNKPNLPSHGHNFAPPRTTTSKGTSLTSDVSHPTAAPIPTHKPVKKMASAVPTKGYVPVNKYNTCANQGKGTLLYSKSPIGLKEDGRSWIDDEKLKVRNQINSSGDLALLNEQNRGPRTNGSKPSSQSGDEHFDSLSVEKNDNGSSATAFLIEDDYNLPDFQTKYEHALFFIIKSYSEDDIHKSIKYNVWASTPNGNKRLDNAFQVAQQMIAEKGIKCPVFLFFSVNASGQFCGVAEIIGRVDFSKNMDFWQQDKWNGYFPVKWHIIKDVPNPQFRHIILENNDNKPVTNSRDTQEVKVSQGSEMLNIFKSYSSKTSILDDFGFYENRQKAMQEKRNKPANPAFNHPLPKHVEPTQVQKPGDSKSLSPNPASGNVKEDLQPSIATTK